MLHSYMNATLAILFGVDADTRIKMSLKVVLPNWFYETVIHVSSEYWCAIAVVSCLCFYIDMFIWLLKSITVIKVLLL